MALDWSIRQIKTA